MLATPLTFNKSLLTINIQAVAENKLNILNMRTGLLTDSHTNKNDKQGLRRAESATGDQMPLMDSMSILHAVITADDNLTI